MPDLPTDSLRLIVMGVSGCGKSTVGGALARQLGLDMIDGDDLHLPESVAKMRSGVALEDTDRWPWLDRVAQVLAQQDPGPGRIVACSALRRSYRDRIRRQVPGLRFIFLDGSFDLIRERLSARLGHYMQPGLLQSQFETLERPGIDEVDVLTLPVDQTVTQLVTAAVGGLMQAAEP
jgi:carbohydrate kinase (thermoresistant glucokinase family)